MSHLTSKTRKIAIFVPIGIVLSACVVLLAFFLQFWFSTTNDIEAACRENSVKGATNFYIEKDSDLEHYIFAVSQDGDDEKGQELFVFHEQSFGTFQNTKRYVLEYHTDQNSQTTVGTYLFTPAQENEERMVFFSDNKEKMDSGKYTSTYNLNGKYYTITVDYELTPYQPFICVSAPLQKEEQITDATFARADTTVFQY